MKTIGSTNILAVFCLLPSALVSGRIESYPLITVELRVKYELKEYFNTNDHAKFYLMLTNERKWRTTKEIANQKHKTEINTRNPVNFYIKS